MVPLSFGNKKITGSQIRGVKRLIHNSDVIFGKEFPDAQSIVWWGIVVMKHPWFLIPQFLPFSFLTHWPHQTPQNVFVNVLIDGFGLEVRTLCEQFPLHQRKRSTSLWLDLDILAFFGLGDVGFFHSRLCRLVNESYSKIHDSPPVIVLPSKFRLVSSRVRVSWHTSTRRSFCSSVNNLETIFAQIFLIPSSSIMIVYTLSLFMLNSFAIIFTVKRRSLRTFCRTRSTFSLVLLVDGFPPWGHLPHLLFLPWTFCATRKLGIVTLLHFHRLAGVNREPLLEFSKSDEKSQVGWFVVQCSSFCHSRKHPKYFKLHPANCI